MSRKIVYFTRIFQNHLILTQKQIIMDLQKLFEEINSMRFTLVAHDDSERKVFFFNMEGRLVNEISFANIQRACHYATALAICGCVQNRNVAKFYVLMDLYSINNINEMESTEGVIFSIENH